MCCPCATSPATAPHPRPPRWRWSNAAAHIADAGYECCSSWQVARAPHTSSSRRLEARRGEPLRTLAGNDSGRSCTYINSIGALRRTHGEDCQALQIAVNSLSARLLVELLAEEPECPHSPSLEAPPLATLSAVLLVSHHGVHLVHGGGERPQPHLCRVCDVLRVALLPTRRIHRPA
jgi:hypothetical protein